MAFCMNCGKQLPDGAKFCLECGTKLGDINAEQAPKRETTYEGTIYKCPNCGDILDAYESVCESCGYERRGTKANNSAQKLADKLQEIEEQRPVEKRISAYRQALNSNTISNTDQQKIDLIKNFPIPNTREDMYEFMVLASANIDMSIYSFSMNSIPITKKAISDAWQAKFEQAYKKAQLSFGKRSDFTDISLLYNQKNEEIRAAKKKKTITTIVAVLCGILIFATCVGTPILLAENSLSADTERVAQENERLDAIVQEVYDAIEEENYVLARAKAASISFSGPTILEGNLAREKWDQVRADLLEIIDKAEQGLEYDPIPIETTG